MSIILNNIGKKYGNIPALHELSFKVDSGEIVGLLGPNGAGKSTLMKILSGLLHPSTGNANICGFDVEMQLLQVRERIGYLPEDNPLYPNMYISEYLSYSAGFYDLGKSKKNRIQEMIEIAGLSAHLNKKIGNLSKGLKQRVGLAQVLLHDPDVLILDEPTSGLDPNQIVDIRNLILELGSEKTILFSSHIMQEIELLCSRVIILDDGKLVADGLTKDMLASESADSTIIVEFSNQVSSEELDAIKGVKKARCLKDNTWLLESGEDIDIRKQIMAFALNKDLSIMSLNQHSKTLEKVFQKLTKKL